MIDPLLVAAALRSRFDAPPREIWVELDARTQGGPTKASSSLLSRLISLITRKR